MHAAIDAADTFAFIISPDSIASEICQLELAHAVQYHKRLVPIVRVEVEAQGIPQALAALNWIFFREHDEFDQAILSLITAIDTDLDWVRAHTRLLLRAKEWGNKDQGTAWVLRGKELEEAEEWLAQGMEKEPRPTTLQSQFIAASWKAERKASEEAQRQAQRIKAGVILTVASSKARTDPTLGVLLLTELQSFDEPFDGLKIAREFLSLPIAQGIMQEPGGHTSPVTHAAFSPDGTRVVTE